MSKRMCKMRYTNRRILYYAERLFNHHACTLPFNLRAALQMAEEIAFENGRISYFEGLVTLTLDRVIQISLKSKKRLWTDGRTGVRTHGQTFETGFIRSTLKSRPKKGVVRVT